MGRRSSPGKGFPLNLKLTISRVGSRMLLPGAYPVPAGLHSIPPGLPWPFLRRRPRTSKLPIFQPPILLQQFFHDHFEYRKMVIPPTSQIGNP
jgi:hypothetical protein